jgi:hypothetical protein
MDCVWPEAHTPASARANNDRVAVKLNIFPCQPGRWKERYRMMDNRGTTNANPNRTFMLRGRRRLGERFRRIRVNMKKAAK